MNNDIKKIIYDVCALLGIKPPKISYDKSAFGSPTMTAFVVPDEYTIYLREYPAFTPDIAFAIVHELRHLWQYTTDKELYFADYRVREDFKDIDAYNLQPAELDAHAFAMAYMEERFGISPTFNNLADATFDSIQNRADEILGAIVF